MLERFAEILNFSWFALCVFKNSEAYFEVTKQKTMGGTLSDSNIYIFSSGISTCARDPPQIGYEGILHNFANFMSGFDVEEGLEKS